MCWESNLLRKAPPSASKFLLSDSAAKNTSDSSASGTLSVLSVVLSGNGNSWWSSGKTPGDQDRKNHLTHPIFAQSFGVCAAKPNGLQPALEGPWSCPWCGMLELPPWMCTEVLLQGTART